MAIRIMTYIGLLYQDLIKTKKVLSGEKLPPVLPIVLYNGAPRWNAPVEVSELIAHVAGGLEIYVRPGKVACFSGCESRPGRYVKPATG